MEVSQTAAQTNIQKGLSELVGGDRREGLQAVGTAAVGGVGGLFAAQELADVVMPMLDMSMDPSTPTELGASALLKLAGAALVAWIAMNMGGNLARAFGGSIAVGMVVSMGLDLFDLGQRLASGGGSTSSIPSIQSGGKVQSTSSPSPSPSGQLKPVNPGADTGSAQQARTTPSTTGGYR